MSLLNGGPAFPTQDEYDAISGGLSMLDYFAAAALPAVIAAAERPDTLTDPLDVSCWAEHCSNLAYDMAEAMICSRFRREEHRAKYRSEDAV